MKSKKRTDLLSAILIYAIFAIFLVIVLFPIIYVFVSSFKTNMEIMSEPGRYWCRKPTFQNYIDAWNSDTLNISRMLFNSVWFTTVSVVIGLTTSALNGYVFERGVFGLKKPLFAIFSSLMFISLGSITIYPLFDILTVLHLNKSLWGLVVLNCFGIPVVNMYMVRSFISGLPRELDEAAIIDGCSFTGVFFRIILPLLKPVMATLGVLGFQASWNSYLMPTIFTMSNPRQQTLIVGIIALKNSGDAAASWNLMFAGTAMALIPVLIAYAFGSRYFTSGITAGAVKG